MPEWLVKVLQEMSSEFSQQQSLNGLHTSSGEKMNDTDWMALAEIYQKIMDVVIGYRTSAVSAGFDPAVADHMAAQLHTFILQKMLAP